MRNAWELQDFSCTYKVFRWRPLTAEERPLEYLPGAPVISHWLRDMLWRQAALEMYEVAYGNAQRGMASYDQQQLAKQIEDAFKRKILVCLRITRESYSAKSEEAEATPPPPTSAPRSSRPTRSRDWIAIELVDDKGKPIPKERFRIELPDGSFAEGYLDAGGHARVDDLDSGNCQITFPDMDGREWKGA